MTQRKADFAGRWPAGGGSKQKNPAQNALELALSEESSWRRVEALRNMAENCARQKGCQLSGDRFIEHGAWQTRHKCSGAAGCTGGAFAVLWGRLIHRRTGTLRRIRHRLWCVCIALHARVLVLERLRVFVCCISQGQASGRLNLLSAQWCGAKQHSRSCEALQRHRQQQEQTHPQPQAQHHVRDSSTGFFLAAGGLGLPTCRSGPRLGRSWIAHCCSASKTGRAASAAGWLAMATIT